MAGMLEGKVAIVTGGGRGIGRGEALLLAAQGAKVVVNDFGGTTAGEGGAAGPADEVAEEIKKMGGEAVANYGNVVSLADGEAMVKQALDTFGRLDILVNNAGISGANGTSEEISEAEWDRVMNTNAKSVFLCTKHAVPLMRRSGGGGGVCAEVGRDGRVPANCSATAH